MEKRQRKRGKGDGMGDGVEGETRGSKGEESRGEQGRWRGDRAEMARSTDRLAERMTHPSLTHTP